MLLLNGPLRAIHKQLILFCTCVALFEGIAYFASLDIIYWGDEGHFVHTIDRFGTDLGLTTLKHYDEMSPPLPFLLYSTWGRIFGFDINTLRIFSVIIAIFTYALFYELLYSVVADSKVCLLAGAFLVLNPYMIGLSVFVFTDMLAILFSLLSCISIRRHRPVLLAVSLSCGLLSRQYLIFFALAVGVYYLLRYPKKDRTKWHVDPMFLSCLVSIIPLASLVFLWKGLSPDSRVRDIYATGGYYFHPSFLTLYVCLFFVYLLPIIVVCWKSIYRDTKVLVGCLVVSWLYWLFPVRPCKAQIDANIPTVGLFHKFLKLTIGKQALEDIAFYLIFLLGLPVAFYFVRDSYLKWQRRELDFLFLLDLSIMAFLLVMPFSYLCWEKYFLPLLPLGTIRILSAKYS